MLTPHAQTSISALTQAGPGPQRSRVLAAGCCRRLSDLLFLLGVAANPPATGADDPEVPVWQLRAGATLFHEGARANHVYVVRSGTFKCFRTAEDGYTQVRAFAARGDVLGFEALCSDHETLAAVALEESTAFALPLHGLDDWRRRFPALDHALQVALSAQLANAGVAAEMLAAVAAEVRLARFLVWQSARMAERGQSPRRLRLTMTRRDVASLLGVAHETVSRSFGVLADWGLLTVHNREVEITDLDGLVRCSRITRPTLGEVSHCGVRLCEPATSHALRSPAPMAQSA